MTKLERLGQHFVMDGHLDPGPGVGQRRAGVPRKPLGKKLATLRRIAPGGLSPPAGN